jgi:hypothetical protein
MLVSWYTITITSSFSFSMSSQFSTMLIHQLVTFSMSLFILAARVTKMAMYLKDLLTFLLS